MTFFTPIINDLIDLRVSIGYSAKTYRNYLFDFDRFISKKFGDATELNERIVMEWSNIRPTEKHSGHKARVSKIRLLAKYMISIGYDAYVLPFKFTSTKTNFVPYIFSDAELTRLFNFADNIKQNIFSPFRHEELPILLRLIYCCGLRPGEGRSIKTLDVDLDNGILLIRENKHKKERLVPMSVNTTEMCRQYIKKLELYMPNSEYLFPSPSGSSYTAWWLKNNLKKIWLKAFPNSTAKVRVYDLRHRFATAILMKWLNEGEDINAKLPYLSAYMGHVNFADTAYYIHLLPDNIIRSSNIDWKHFNSLIPEVE